MLSRKRILAAMAGLAMMAVPISALAKHHDDFNNQRPQAWHDQGSHNGRAQRQFAPAMPARVGRPFVARPYAAEPRVAQRFAPAQYGRAYDQRPGSYWATPRRIGWDDNDDRGRRNWDDHRWNRNGDQNYGCDADGDNCRWNNNYGSQYWQNNGGYDYGAPYSWYEAQPPASYGLAQQRAWLIQRRQRAMMIIAQMRARGDRRGADRMVSVVRGLDRRIARLNGYGYNAYSGYAPSAYYGSGADYQSSPLSPLLAGAAPYYGNSNPYYGNPNPYYGNNTGYSGNPTTDALVSALPMLFSAH